MVVYFTDSSELSLDYKCDILLPTKIGDNHNSVSNYMQKYISSFTDIDKSDFKEEKGRIFNTITANDFETVYSSMNRQERDKLLEQLFYYSLEGKYSPTLQCMTFGNLAKFVQQKKFRKLLLTTGDRYLKYDPVTFPNYIGTKNLFGINLMSIRNMFMNHSDFLDSDKFKRYRGVKVKKDVHFECKNVKRDRVVIIGGGPVGIYTGINLLKRGFTVTLFEIRSTYSREQILLLQDNSTYQSLADLDEDVIKSLEKVGCYQGFPYVTKEGNCYLNITKESNTKYLGLRINDLQAILEKKYTSIGGILYKPDTGKARLEIDNNGTVTLYNQIDYFNLVIQQLKLDSNYPDFKNKYDMNPYKYRFDSTLQKMINYVLKNNIVTINPVNKQLVLTELNNQITNWNQTKKSITNIMGGDITKKNVIDSVINDIIDIVINFYNTSLNWSFFNEKIGEVQYDKYEILLGCDGSNSLIRSDIIKSKCSFVNPLENNGHLELVREQDCKEDVNQYTVGYALLVFIDKKAWQEMKGSTYDTSISERMQKSLDLSQLNNSKLSRIDLDKEIAKIVDKGNESSLQHKYRFFFSKNKDWYLAVILTPEEYKHITNKTQIDKQNNLVVANRVPSWVLQDDLVTVSDIKIKPIIDDMLNYFNLDPKLNEVGKERLKAYTFPVRLYRSDTVIMKKFGKSIILVGDSAIGVHFFGGTGVNTGIKMSRKLVDLLSFGLSYIQIEERYNEFIDQLSTDVNEVSKSVILDIDLVEQLCDEFDIKNDVTQDGKIFRNDYQECTRSLFHLNKNDNVRNRNRLKKYMYNVKKNVNKIIHTVLVTSKDVQRLKNPYNAIRKKFIEYVRDSENYVKILPSLVDDNAKTEVFNNLRKNIVDELHRIKTVYPLNNKIIQTAIDEITLKNYDINIP
jgi:hypothetical protein